MTDSPKKVTIVSARIKWRASNISEPRHELNRTYLYNRILDMPYQCKENMCIDIATTDDFSKRCYIIESWTNDEDRKVTCDMLFLSAHMVTLSLKIH